MDVALTWVGGEGAVVRMWLRAEAALRHQSAVMHAQTPASASVASAAAARDGKGRRGGTHLCKVAAPECDGLLLGHRAVAVGVHLIEEALVRMARARVRGSHDRVEVPPCWRKSFAAAAARVPHLPAYLIHHETASLQPTDHPWVHMLCMACVRAGSGASTCGGALSTVSTSGDMATLDCCFSNFLSSSSPESVVGCAPSAIRAACLNS